MNEEGESIYDKIRRNNHYFEDFVTRSIYHSNAIEGSTLSYAETYAIVFNDNSMKVNALPRELYEAINLKYALDCVLKSLDNDITLDYVKDLGITINKNISDISGFRTTAVFIRGVEHIPPNAYDVPRLLQELLCKYNNSESEMFKALAEFHLGFERIHPFSDGNGRTGRLLITKELLRNGYPPLIIPIERRGVYMKHLAEQNTEALSQLFRQAVDTEYERMEKFGISLKRMDIF